MNYEKIILEMLERIKILEEKVDTLSEYNADVEGGDDETNDDILKEVKESGRTLSRKKIMRILSDQFGLNARKGNRSEGSGIVISKGEKSYNIKVSYSRSYFNYITEEVICSGWHTLFKKEIENQDFPFFIFVVADAEDKFHYFIFKREDLIKEFDYKVYDAKNKLHFYFRVKEDGSPVELRETEKDMSRFYGNWNIFLELKG